MKTEDSDDKMTWIVIGYEKGKVKLVSKRSNMGLLPKGSFLTIDNELGKFILRVDASEQDFPYDPLPMIVDMGLKPLKQDQKCQNIVHAYPIKDLNQRSDGLINYIQPLMEARRSNQKEIDYAMGQIQNISSPEGPKVFLATVHGTQNQILTDESGKYLTANLPVDMFYHQMMVCGKTGSGKTVCTKYLAQYFVEQLEGAVLAINVKDIDFLRMDFASNETNEQIEKEWSNIDGVAHGVNNFIVYYPATCEMALSKGINQNICKKISLDVKTVDPNALIGILQGITDLGARFLPDIFRFWQEEFAPAREKREPNYFRYSNFVRYFRDGLDGRRYRTKNTRGEIDNDGIPLHSSTATNIHANLAKAVEYFDDPNAKILTEDDILQKGLLTVIDLENEQAKNFGSILLRHLLGKIVQKKSANLSKVPILIIIDEVHQFYNTQSTKEALGDLDTICRQGRSQKIGVIFSSQTPSDINKNLSDVINTKIFFKSDVGSAKAHGVPITEQEMESLMKGYALGSIYGLSQLKIMKFPLSYAGVIK